MQQHWGASGPATLDKVFPLRFYGDGAETIGLNSFELLTMLSVSPQRSSTLKTRFVFLGLFVLLLPHHVQLLGHWNIYIYGFFNKKLPSFELLDSLPNFLAIVVLRSCAIQFFKISKLHPTYCFWCDVVQGAGGYLGSHFGTLDIQVTPHGWNC